MDGEVPNASKEAPCDVIAEKKPKNDALQTLPWRETQFYCGVHYKPSSCYDCLGILTPIIYQSHFMCTKRFMRFPCSTNPVERHFLELPAARTVPHEQKINLLWRERPKDWCDALRTLQEKVWGSARACWHVGTRTSAGMSLLQRTYLVFSQLKYVKGTSKLQHQSTNS